jgi:hypothetical protein
MHWMFRAWLPERWALVGGLLVVLQLGVSSYWAQSYWGGAVAAVGGALVFGAVRRLADEPAVPGAIALGLGLAILANSRPFEGLVVSLFAAAALAWFFVGREPDYRHASLRRVAVPLLLVLAVTGLAMATYNRTTTGDAFRMPYQVYAGTYSMGSFFPWKESVPLVEFRHEIMREYAIEWGQERLSALRDPRRFAVLGVIRTVHRAWFFLGTFSVVALVGIPLLFRSRWFVFAGVVVLVVWTLSLFTTAYPHYVAPASALGVVSAVEAARRLAVGREGIRPGLLLVLLAALLELVRFGTSLGQPQYLTTAASPVKVAFAADRAEVVERLTAIPDRDLVFVRYGPGHSFHREWVYNRSDIDEAEIVWARDMGEQENRRLMSYFADRTVWLLTASGSHQLGRESYREVISLDAYKDRTEEPGM